MPKTDAMRRAQNKWDAANRATLGVRVSKDESERFRAICEASGQTVNAALVEYVRACLERGSLPHPAAPKNPDQPDPARSAPQPEKS